MDDSDKNYLLKIVCPLSWVATVVFNVRLLHAFSFSKKLPWFKPAKVISLKTQLHAVNACVKRSSQRSFTSFSPLISLSQSRYISNTFSFSCSTEHFSPSHIFPPQRHILSIFPQKHYRLFLAFQHGEKNRGKVTTLKFSIAQKEIIFLFLLLNQKILSMFNNSKKKKLFLNAYEQFLL